MRKNLLTNPLYVPLGPRELEVIFGDGGLDLSPVEELRFYKTVSPGLVLQQWDGYRQVDVEEQPPMEEYFFSFKVRESSNPIAVQALKNRFRPATKETFYRLRCEKKVKQLFVDHPRAHNIPGLVQSLSETEFPKPTGGSATSPTGGTLLSTQNHAQVVPFYIDPDQLQGGIDPADFTLANFANYIRGVHYVCGTPSDDITTVVTDNDKLSLTWVAPVIPDGEARPSGFIVLVGTGTAITTKKVSAIVLWGTLAAEVADIGTEDFAAPASADFEVTQRGIDNSGTRDWGGILTSGTDYSYDAEIGETSLPEGSTNDGAMIRTCRWWKEAYTVVMDDNDPVTEFHVGLRTIDARSNDPDPASARATGDMWTGPKTNAKAWSVQDCVVSSDTDYDRNGIVVSGKFLKSTVTDRNGTPRRCTLIHEKFSPAQKNYQAMYDDEIAAATD